MTTPSIIEEKYEEYRKKFLLATGPGSKGGIQLYCSRCSGSEEFHTFFTKALTEAYQVGIRDAFRAGYLAGQEHKDPGDAYEDFIKALQNKK